MPAPDWLTDPTYRNVYQTTEAQRVADVSYEQWIDFWFGGAIVASGYPWFQDVPYQSFKPEMASGYARRLFTHAQSDLEYFHDDQIGAGMWLLISEDGIYLSHPDVPIHQREACLLATVDLFRDLFANRCGLILSHGSGEQPLINTSCYMWWEYLTHIAFPGDPNFERMRTACFDVMERTLAIPHIAVQEAALHGLGHEVRRSDRAQAVIERFLAEPGNAPPELLQYARAALSGCIQ